MSEPPTLRDLLGRAVQALERLADAQEREADAQGRLATAAERQAGLAVAKRKRAATKRRVPTDAPVDDLSRARARAMLRNSGFGVDGDE